MFGPLGFAEILFILAIALLVFGPKRLPEVGRTLGKGLREFRKASNELRRSVEDEIHYEEAAPRAAAPAAQPVADPTPRPAVAAVPAAGALARGEGSETAPVSSDRGTAEGSAGALDAADPPSTDAADEASIGDESTDDAPEGSTLRSADDETRSSA